MQAAHVKDSLDGESGSHSEAAKDGLGPETIGPLHEASCKFVLACPGEAPERRVETETTSRLIEWPSHPRASEYARKRPEMASVRRWRVRNPHTIAHTDGILFCSLRQRSAQTADMNVDSALVYFRRKPPNAVEQLRAGKDAARFRHQMVDQAELGRAPCAPRGRRSRSRSPAEACRSRDPAAFGAASVKWAMSSGTENGLTT